MFSEGRPLTRGLDRTRLRPAENPVSDAEQAPGLVPGPERPRGLRTSGAALAERQPREGRKAHSGLLAHRAPSGKKGGGPQWLQGRRSARRRRSPKNNLFLCPVRWIPGIRRPVCVRHRPAGVRRRRCRLPEFFRRRPICFHRRFRRRPVFRPNVIRHYAPFPICRSAAHNTPGRKGSVVFGPPGGSGRAFARVRRV